MIRISRYVSLLLVGLLAACEFPFTTGGGVRTPFPTEPVSPVPSIVSSPSPVPFTATATKTRPAPMPTSTTTPLPTVSVEKAAFKPLYTIQTVSPRAISGFPHPELGCGWMGVGGQVFGLDAKPVINLIAEIGGTLAGQTISQSVLTGQATAWGPGGFEFKLNDLPIESTGTVWLQFFDLNGTPVTERIYLNTSNDCSQNSILINLVQVKPLLETFIPFISTK